MQISATKQDFVAGVALVAPSLASAVASDLDLSDRIAFHLPLGPFRAGVTVALSAWGSGIQIDITSITGNLFGVARGLANRAIVKRLSAVPGVTCRMVSGNPTAFYRGVLVREITISAGVITLTAACGRSIANVDG
jgi:hypothetical protein